MQKYTTVSNTDLYLSYFDLSYIFPGNNDSVEQGLTACISLSFLCQCPRERISERIRDFFTTRSQPKQVYSLGNGDNENKEDNQIYGDVLLSWQSSNKANKGTTKEFRK